MGEYLDWENKFVLKCKLHLVHLFGNNVFKQKLPASSVFLEMEKRRFSKQ